MSCQGLYDLRICGAGALARERTAGKALYPFAYRSLFAFDPLSAKNRMYR